MSKPAPKVATPAPPAPALAAVVEKPNVTAEAARMTSVFAIEDNIPPPVKRIGVKGVSSYPFVKLAIGQSFFVPVTAKVTEPWKTLTSMASRMTREHWPIKFTTARVAADAAKGTPEGVRIWRTADGEGDLPEQRKRPKKEAVAAAAEPAAQADPFVPTAA